LIFFLMATALRRTFMEKYTFTLTTDYERERNLVKVREVTQTITACAGAWSFSRALQPDKYPVTWAFTLPR
jgi:hypothetical protein